MYFRHSCNNFSNGGDGGGGSKDGSTQHRNEYMYSLNKQYCTRCMKKYVPGHRLDHYIA